MVYGYTTSILRIRPSDLGRRALLGGGHERQVAVDVLTALWRAKGRPENKRPADWFSTEEGRAWRIAVRDGNSSARGAQGGVWRDDIQAALQYAAYLDPALREDIYDRT